jgi:DNA-binding NtrC family response regulator
VDWAGFRTIKRSRPYRGSASDSGPAGDRSVAAVWSDEQEISDIRDALPPVAASMTLNAILNRSLDSGIDLPALMSDVARHYLQRAVQQANGNKARATEVLGLPSYQTLTNWLRKYEGPEA